MKRVLFLAFLMFSSVLQAGFFEDVFGFFGQVANDVSQTVFGSARIDAESICVEKTIEYFQPELISNWRISDQLAFGAYNYFNECKQKEKTTSEYLLDCSKKQKLESFCSIIKAKCENANFASSDLKTARSFGACANAEKMCKESVKKNYSSCGKKIRN